MAGPTSKKSRREARKRLLISIGLILLLLAAIWAVMEQPFDFGGEAPVAAGTHVSPSAPPAPAPTPTLTPGQDSQDTFGAHQVSSLPAEGALDIYVLDVGQGDSIFLRSPSGKTMLVDAGTGGMYGRIDSFLKEQNVKKLDVVIGTHPHADHIGGMRKIVQSYEISTYYMPDAVTQTKTFENLLDTLLEKQVTVVRAVAGESSFIPWDDAVEVRILSPFEGREYTDLNNFSVVCRVRYDDTSIMLTGDAEAEAERFTLNELSPSCFSATILKLGHHGSSSSTSAAFLQAVTPEIAIASLGADNTYGHPHKETLAILQEFQIPLYRTDENGTIHIRMNGSAFALETEK